MNIRKLCYLLLVVGLSLVAALVANRSPLQAATSGVTTRVSVSSNGIQSNEASSVPAMSADGRYVAFSSGASNLVPGDTNGQDDIFVRDRTTGRTTRVSVASDGTESTGGAAKPAISADGRYVAFASSAGGLVPGDNAPGRGGIFVRDRSTGQTMLVSSASDGTPGNNYSDTSAISADGRYVAFSSLSSNLVPGDTNDRTDIFVHDRSTGQTTRVSVASDGIESNNTSYGPAMSADGRYVAFSSGASNLVPGATDLLGGIFVHDRNTGHTTRISVGFDLPLGPAMSADGRYVAFATSDPNLVPDDTNQTFDVFMYDRIMGQTTRVSVASDGTQGNKLAAVPAISVDGRYVAFWSEASNLVPGDTNGQSDIFVHDRTSGHTTRVSTASNGAQGNRSSGSPAISGDGRSVAFESYASNLVPNDTNNLVDIFVHDGTTVLASYAGTIVPVYPASNTLSSRVMQGGAAYRHLRLMSPVNAPVPSARIIFSRGAPTTTDADGYFVATVDTTAFMPPNASYEVRVQTITTGGITYAAPPDATFGVDVVERRYEHAWSYGTSSQLKAGVSAKIVAYVRGQTSGGLEIRLAESDPNRTSDDTVSMEEVYSAESGAGGGAGLSTGVRVLGFRGKAGSEAIAEFAHRAQGRTTARFPAPYQSDNQKAQAVFLLASLVDSGASAAGKPFVVHLLQQALDRRAPYAAYVHEQQAGFGFLVTPLHVDVGAKGTLEVGGLKLSKLDLTVVDTGISGLAFGSLTEYQERGEWGVAATSEYVFDWSLLSAGLGKYKRVLPGWLGDRATRIVCEFIFDRTTNQLKRLELSFTGLGNTTSLGGGLESVTTRFTIPAEHLGTDRLSRAANVLRLLQAAQNVDGGTVRLGPSAMAADLNALLDGLAYATYDVTADDGSSDSYEPGLGAKLGIEIDVGVGLEVTRLRTLVRERGIVQNGTFYRTESYGIDPLVARPGKSWSDLTANALSGILEYVNDAVSSVRLQITEGTQWAIDVVSRTTSGIVKGGARLRVPATPELASAPAGLEATGTLTVTARAWAPALAIVGADPALRSGIAAASGSDFVLGGIYDFQPSSLALPTGATIALTSTSDLLAGLDPARVRVFRWEGERNNWQPVPTDYDAAVGTFTGQVTRLGTYALGYDVTPPEVTIISPADGSTITETLPLIRAVMSDAGVGVEPQTLRIRLDGQVVVSTFITDTGELAYLPSAPLATGGHQLVVEAEDVMGNSRAVTSTFTIDAGSRRRVFLPLVGR